MLAETTKCAATYGPRATSRLLSDLGDCLSDQSQEELHEVVSMSQHTGVFALQGLGSGYPFLADGPVCPIVNLVLGSFINIHI